MGIRVPMTRAYLYLGAKACGPFLQVKTDGQNQRTGYLWGISFRWMFLGVLVFKRDSMHG